MVGLAAWVCLCPAQGCCYDQPTSVRSAGVDTNICIDQGCLLSIQVDLREYAYLAPGHNCHPNHPGLSWAQVHPDTGHYQPGALPPHKPWAFLHPRASFQEAMGLSGVLTLSAEGSLESKLQTKVVP